MNDFITAVQVLLAFMGGLTVLAGGVKVIVSVLSPFKEIQKRLKQHDEYFKSDLEKITALEKKAENSDHDTNMLYKTLLAMTDHMITGNGVDKLKKTKEELQDYLIDRP